MSQEYSKIQEEEEEEESKEIRIVVIGRTGGGKSDTCNSLVSSPKRKTFACSFGSRSKTKESQLLRTEILGRNICLVDTPGFFDTELGDKVHTEILKCVTILAPGPHVILYVLDMGRQTDEVISTVKKLQDTFGNKCTNHMVFVFTHKDQLDRCDDIKDIKAYVQTMKDDVQKLLRECNDRFIAFDNTLDTSSEENKNQVADLFRIVDEMLENNNRAHFSNDDLHNAMQELHTRRKQQKRVINKKLVNLSEQFKQTVAKANETSKLLEKLQHQEKNGQQKRIKLETELDEKEELLNKIMKEQEKRENEIENLRKEREEDKSKHNKLDKKIKETEKELENLKKQYTTVNTEKSNVEEQLKEKTKEKDSAERKRKTCEEELVKVQEEGKHLWSDIETLVETRAKAQIEFSEVVEELKRERKKKFHINLPHLGKLMDKIQNNACAIM